MATFAEYTQKKKKENISAKGLSFSDYTNKMLQNNDIAPIRTTTTSKDDDIGPVKKSLFDDGYDFGDITKTILGSREQKEQKTSDFDNALMQKYSAMSLADIEKEYARVEAEEKAFKDENGGKLLNYLTKAGSYIAEGKSGTSGSATRSKSQANIDKINDLTREKEIINVYRKQRATEEYLGGLNDEQLQLLDSISESDALEDIAPINSALANMTGGDTTAYNNVTASAKKRGETSREKLYNQLKEKNPKKSDEELNEIIDNMVELRRNQVNAEEQATRNTELKDATTENAVGSAILSRGANILGGVTGLTELYLQRDNEYGLDTNAAGFMLTNSSNTIDEQVQLDHDWTVEVGGAKIDAFDFMYNAGTGVIDNLGRLALSGGNTTVSSMMMFAQSTTQSIIEGKEKGYSDAKALTMGLLNGTFEALSEKISLDIILGEGGNALKKIAKSFVAEGGEELTSNWLNRIADEVANGNHSELSKMYDSYINEGYTEAQALVEVICSVIGEDFETFLIGGLSGGFMGGSVEVARTVSNKTSTKSEKNTVGKLVEEKVAEATKKQAIEKTVNKAIEERETEQGGKLSDENKKALRETIEAKIESGEIDISSEKLSKKDIAKIEKEVKGLLNDGNIEVSKIEEILTLDETNQINELKETLDNTKDEQKKAEIEGKIKQLETARLENLKKQARDNKYLRTAIAEYNASKTTYQDDSEVTDEYEKAVVESAKKYANNTKLTRKFVDIVRKLAKDRQTRYIFTNNQALLEQGDLKVRDKISAEEQAKIKSLEKQLSEATTEEAKADIQAQIIALKYYDTGGLVRKNENGVETVIINVDSIQSKYSVVGHETKHTLEKYELNEKFNELLFEYAKNKGDLDAVRSRIESIYKNQEDADIDGEVAAELTGKYLFEDEKFLDTLLKNKSDSKVQQIIEKIKELIDDLVVRFKGTDQEKQLREVQKKFTELYNSTDADIVNEITEGTQYSIDNNQNLVYNDSRGERYVRTDEFKRLQAECQGMSDEDIQLYHSGNRKIDEKLRADIAGILRTQINSYRDGLRDDNGILSLVNKGNEFNMCKSVNGSLFHDVFEIAQKYLLNGELVDLHTVETTEDGIGYDDCYNYLSEDGLSGFSITPDGDLISVFNASGKSGFLGAIAPFVKENSKTLDCYNSPNQPLCEMYERMFGFKTASVMDYNMEYDHDNIAENHNKPKVAFMVNTENHVETKNFTKDEYDEAVAYRNSFINQAGSNGSASSIAEKKQYSLGLEDIETKYKDKTDYLFLHERNDTISISNMVVKEEYRNQGVGTQILNDIIAYADENGKTITLTPTTEFGTQNKLKKWYKANGFVENKGRNADLRLSDTMYRLPKKNTKYSLSYSDNKYIDAVNRGDNTTAQKLVDEAAKENGYTIKAYHGTPSNNFTTFDTKKIGSNTDAGIFGSGFYFTTHKETAGVYATESGHTMPVYLRVNNPWWAVSHRNIQDVAEELGMDRDALTLRGYGGKGRIVTPTISQTGQFSAHLQEHGYDAVVVQHGSNNYEIVVFDSDAIKSADLVTYDNNGNIIPLSERFNESRDDIRYSLAKQDENVDYSKSLRSIKYQPMDDLPIREDVAKNTTTTFDDIAPMKDSKKSKATKEPIAKILTNEPESKKKSPLWSKIKTNFIDKASPFESLALKTGNREVDAKFNSIRYSDTKAQLLIGEGADGVKALNDIKAEVEKDGLTEKLYKYLYHKHNVDRMSFEDREAPNLERLTEEIQKLKLNKLNHNQLLAISKESITKETSKKRAHLIETVREYLKSKDVKNKPVFGDSVTAEMSQKIVDEYEADNPKLIEYANDVYNYNNYLRNMLVENGVISPETAKLWEEIYPHYVPVRRIDSKGLNINVPLDSGRTGINAPVKRAKGGNTDILPLFETMAQRTMQTYKAIAKNKFGVELKNTLGTTITSEETSLDEVIDSIDTHEELLQKGDFGSNPTFTVFEGGEKVTFEITDEMYDAMKPTSEGLAYTNKVANTISNSMRGVLTEYNPTFMLTNAIKDAQDVLINSQHPAKTYKNFPKAVKELASKGKWYTEYIQNGGADNTYFDKQTTSFNKEKSKLSKVIGFPLEKISFANNFIERIPRLAEYIASRESGRSVDVSMLDAARVTTNFAAGGDVTKFLNRNGATFLNASVQGAAQQVRNVREAKANGLKGWVQLATKVALAGLPAMLLNGLLWDDDEEYEELSDYVKQNYYVVAKTQDGKFVRIPKGRALAVIQEAFTQVQNALTGDDEVDLNSFLELAISNLAPNNPIDNNIIAPIMQVKNNETWYGEDLVPTRLQDVPDAEQYDESTDAISKWLGEKLNYSPYKINYLLNQYSGGLGDIVLPMLTPEAESGDNSLLARFGAPMKDKFSTDSVFNNQNTTDFYNVSEELTVNANSINATDEDILKSKYFNSISSEIGELYKEKREIQNSNLSDDLKYKQVRDIQKQINEITKEALLNVNGTQGATEPFYGKGNIDLNNRPIVRNEDGSISTVRSMSINEDGKEILIPTVVNGKIVSDKEAIEHYHRTGEYLGIFNTVEEANAYADKLHLEQEQFYRNKGSGLSISGNYATIGGLHYKKNDDGEWQKITGEQLEKQNEVTSGLDITPSEYWSNKTEYDYAYTKPEKYAVSKAVGGYDAYKTYSSQLNNIEADKDSNGKSISGSRKKKVFDYINNLNIDYGAKCILLKSEYSSEDRYNKAIVDYLNSRDDITTEEKKTILEELGATIDSNGYIHW